MTGFAITRESAWHVNGVAYPSKDAAIAAATTLALAAPGTDIMVEPPQRTVVYTA